MESSLQRVSHRPLPAVGSPSGSLQKFGAWIWGLWIWGLWGSEHEVLLGLGALRSCGFHGVGLRGSENT